MTINQTQITNIKWLILDVDGVLTDGSLHYSNLGDSLKVFNALDGHGLKLCTQFGIQIAIITGSQCAAIKTRLTPLGIKYIFQGATDKLSIYNQFKTTHDIKDETVAYMGDDLPDLPIMCRIGLAVAPPNAIDIVQQYAHHITIKSGGKGAVRELCDMLLQTKPEYLKFIQEHTQQNEKVTD